MPKVDYDERQQAKKERYQELADKNKKASEDSFSTSKKMSDVIPFGQPILIGHHSENRDRNYRKRIEKKFEKGIEEGKKSEYYQDKVNNIEKNYNISQDDPDAIKRLKEKIVNLEKERKEIKSRSHQGWELSNLGATIRNCKKRIDQLDALDKIESKEWKNNNITLEINKEVNRIMIYFPGKPDEETRKKLKSHGFRWSPYNSAWQSYIKDWNLDFAKTEILKLPKENKKTPWMSMDEADPGLTQYHENFRRSTIKLRELYNSPLADDKFKTVIKFIFLQRGLTL